MREDDAGTVCSRIRYSLSSKLLQMPGMALLSSLEKTAYYLFRTVGMLLPRSFSLSMDQMSASSLCVNAITSDA